METIFAQHNESEAIPDEKSLISFDEAIERLTRDDRFKATVYAMNTLLIHKGVYSQEEFESHFCEWAQKQK